MAKRPSRHQMHKEAICLLQLGPLNPTQSPGVLIAAPLDLAFIALGYHLWTVDLKSSAEGVEVRA